MAKLKDRPTVPPEQEPKKGKVLPIIGILVIVLALLTIAGMFILPSRYVVVAPAPAKPVGDLLRVSGGTLQPSGQFLATAVIAIPANPITAFDAKFLNPYSDLVPKRATQPPGLDRQQAQQMQREEMEESVQVAAAVATRLAGLSSQATADGARVFKIQPGSPVEGKLQEGDVIVAANGQPVRLAVELATRTYTPDQPVVLDVRRNGAPLRVAAVPRRTLTDDAVSLGIIATTVNPRIRLPDGVQARPNDAALVGGPSAGLMFTLDIYQRFKSDLTRGRKIAGTGTIATDGGVGPVAGIKEKVRAAQLAGATMFFVPVVEADQARAAAPPEMQVIPVSNAREAITALER